MIFEGSEKKVEIIVSDKLNLRSYDQDFYKNLVAKSKATILSSISSKGCDAYLLSESSLFVWQDRLTMITCGTTTLVRAVEFLLEELGKKSIQAIIFQRKNEHFSDLQNSTFYDDYQRLKESMPGVAYRFGPKHEHHNFLYHASIPYKPLDDDFTSELLMYDIQGEAKNFLLDPHQTATKIRDFFQFNRLLEGFEFDDFVFEPYGYSMNGLRDHYYCTMHITPQEISSYVSFETNLPLDAKTQSLFDFLIKRLRPKSFDSVAFNCEMQSFMPKSYHKKTVVQHKLDIGYDVRFCHYFLESDQTESAYRF